jgi:isopenicillin N synthase-like dioxygenase
MTVRIPVIDLAPALGGASAAARLEVARAIDRACVDTGFFTITGHGVPSAVIDTLRTEAHAFFALPMEEKRRAIHPVAQTPRGYIAMGGEALSYAAEQESPPDLKEFYHCGRGPWPQEPYFTSPEGQRYFVPNLWPERPAGLGAAAERYYDVISRLDRELMRLAALALGIDEHFFDTKVDKHISAMRLNFYPAQPTAPQPDQLRAGAHTDYGLLTILNGEAVPGGLQIKARDGGWIDVETAPDQFVINIGDLMMRWSNDRWLSNLHRVVNPPASVAAQAKRLSIAFFLHPNYDAVIECIAKPGEAKHPPVGSGEYRDFKYRQTRVAAE